MTEYLVAKKLLKEKGIDIDDDKMLFSAKYKDIKYSSHIHTGKDYVTYDYYVEKILRDQNRLRKLKKGKFNIGIDLEYTDDDLKESILCEEISECLKYDVKATPKNINQNINRDKRGLIARFNSVFKIDLKNDFINERASKFKLLKWLYLFETEYGINLIKLLENPSLENVDNSLVEIKTANGLFLAAFKSECTKEISQEFRIEAKRQVSSIVTGWEELIRFMYSYLDCVKLINITDDINRINVNLKLMKENICSSTIKSDFENSLFETIYLKLLQHENLGRQADIVKANIHVAECDFFSSMTLLSEIKDEYVDIESIDRFVENNITFITKLIYCSEKVGSNQYRKVRNSVMSVKTLLDWISSNNNYRFKDGVPIKLLISCFQEAVFLDKKEKIANKYHRYTSAEPTLYTEINRGKDAHAAAQIVLVRRVIGRYLHNRGLGEEATLIYSNEKVLDEILIQILSIPNITDMRLAYNFLSQRINWLVCGDDFINGRIQYFENTVLKTTGYSVEMYDTIRETFFRETRDSEIIDQLILQFLEYISDKSEVSERFGKKTPMELRSHDDSYFMEFEVTYYIDKKLQKISIVDFQLMPSEDSLELIKKLRKLGINFL